jgi:tRNA 5-methylaminomethyl-2-thiouridine biosynthesis bifunctional protein
MYDVAIIGAGINGCSAAYEFTQEKKSVLLLDKAAIAAGGSGAAGAFISPKFSKAGELKELLREAFIYSLDFYEKQFPTMLTKAQLLHLAQDESDAEILREYKKSSDLELLREENEKREYVSINAGVVDAKAMCEAMAKDAKFVQENVDSLIYDDGLWIINETYSAKEVVLATGAYTPIIKEPYIQLRGVWGHRIDIKTTTTNPYSVHQFVSISPSKDGMLAIGATHNVHYHPQTATEPYDVNEGRAELLEKASRTMELENVEVIKDYTGLRSGSFDYMPMVGPLVLSHETLQNPDIRFKVKHADYKEYSYYPHLTMINGSGGYGFVLAPYLAKMLKEYILSAKPLSDRISPARFFARYAKKLP